MFIYNNKFVVFIYNSLFLFYNCALFFICFWLQFLAPAGVGVVTTVSRTSSSLTLSWDTPTQPNGLVTAYAVTLTPLTTFGLSVATGNATAVPLEVRIPEMVLLVVARGLAPATTYSAVLNASTSGGTGTGPTVQLATEESGEILEKTKF